MANLYPPRIGVTFLKYSIPTSEHDKTIQELLNTNCSASYTSPGLKNLMINLIGDLVHKKKCDEGIRAGALSILVDRARVVATWDKCQCYVQERFLSFVEALVLFKMLQVSPHLSLIHCMRMNWLPK